MRINIQDQIVKWASKKLSKWQQDALRRVIEQESVSNKDIKELLVLCKKENDIEVKGDSKIQPKLLKVNSLKKGQNGNYPEVSLLAIKNAVDVNALAPGQNLTFNPKGLIVIYGDTGAGKTGYCRVIKAVTRARAQNGVILRNYTSDGQSQQTALIEYSVDGKDKSFSWMPTCSPPPELANVSFFDSSCASVYVEKETDVAYRPYSLDILDKLVSITDEVKTKLQEEIARLQQGADIPFEDFKEGTEVYGLISNLGQEDIKAEDIEKLSNLKSKDLKRKEFLSQNLSENDPIKIRQKIVSISNEAKKIENLRNHIKSLREDLSSEAVAESLSLRDSLNTVSKAAQVAAKDTFSNTLPGTGGGVWQTLWESARRYSQVVYKDKKFPVIDNKAKCLLCQQELDKNSKKRLRSFEDFIKNDLSQRELQLKNRFTGIVDYFESIQASDKYYDSIVESIGDEKLRKEIKDLLEDINQLQKDIVAALKSNKKISSSDILPIFESRLSDYLKELEAQIESLEDILKKDRSKLESELRELEDRCVLAKKKDGLLKLHKKLCLINKIRACEEKINTASISKKNGKLTQKLITEQLIKTFKDELSKLNLHSIKIELKQIKNEKGVSYFRVLIHHPKGQEINVGKIASKGEHRTIALAGFLTELSTAEHKSTIVLDDPISSVDHSRRTSIALRLIQEAKSRQVVIFTHDLVFLFLLERYCRDLSIPISTCRLEGEDKGKGVVYSGKRGKPWIAMAVNDRISFLKDRLVEARKKKKQSEEEYDLEARNVYGLLRDTWERAVEEVLLYGVIQRFQEGVETKKLRHLTDISQEDYETIYSNMEKCSRFKHDQSISVNVPIPDPDELEKDIIVLEDWVKILRKDRGRN
ncbi:MAG TPA: hypothetical protein VMW41_00440 [Candidatus Bathyarchaeia archaeon]|nr:hypothetical protein [Candidatus Bathyarchaeia archaeon]